LRTTIEPIRLLVRNSIRRRRRNRDTAGPLADDVAVARVPDNVETKIDHQ